MTTPTTTRPTTPERPRSLGYHPSLDGLRGLALVAIIVYHSGLDWAPGAFLSVSTFFTLSGFLITSLLLAEHARSDRVSLKSFWDRRLRRLMPAALVAILGIVGLSIVVADLTQMARLRGDAWASIAYVANWRFIAEGDAYGATFQSASPFTHFWSLAIEEQFYLVLPLLVVGALSLGKGSRRVVATVLGVAAASSVLWANILVAGDASINRLYFGTDVRAAEIIAGALLAVWWMRRPDPLSERTRRTLGVLGPAALVAMVLLWVPADLNDVAFYRGGLAAYSLLTLTVIAGALSGRGPIPKVLATPALAWIGLVSYAAYLVHYPILLFLGQRGLEPIWRLAIAVPVTFGLAALSVRFLEGPIRKGLPASPRTVVVAAVGAATVTAVLVWAATAWAGPVDQADLETAAVLQRFLEQTEAQNESDAPRIAMYGDSTAVMTGRGLSELSRQRPEDFVASAGWAELGCGLVDTGSRRVLGEELGVPDSCAGWEDAWRAAATESPADLAVVQLGPWDVVDTQLEPGGPVLTIGEDPELDAELTERLRNGVDILLEQDSAVVLLAPPDIEMGRVGGKSPPTPSPASDPARMQRFREILRTVADGNDRVRVVDLCAWVQDQPDDDELRPDGVHFTDESTGRAAQWLAPQLTEVFTEITGRTTTEFGTAPS